MPQRATLAAGGHWRKDMLRWLNGNVRNVLGWALLAAPLASGCSTKEPVLWSAAHNKRIALTLIDGFSHPTLLNPIPFDQAHNSFDRIFYGIEEYPNEPYMDHW